jgi:hypothetical protein
LRLYEAVTNPISFAYFAVGDLNKAWNLAICDYDSAMMIATKSYDYESAVGFAAEYIKKHGLSANFPTFTEDSYKTPTKYSPVQMRFFGCASFPLKICMPRFMTSWMRIVPI